MSGTPADPQNGTPVAAGEVQRDANDEVEILGAGGGDAGVQLIKPAVVYTQLGEVHRLEDSVVKAVDDFQTPTGFVRKGTREASFMYSLGVHVEKQDNREGKLFCMANANCRRTTKVVPCKGGDRSNVNSHLRSKHGLVGRVSVVKADKKSEVQKDIKESMKASKNSKVGLNRVREIKAVRMLVDKFLPFSFFSSTPSWQELSGVLTADDAPFSPISARRVKHVVVEMYVATKKKVVGNMQEEIKKAPLAAHHPLPARPLDVQALWA